MRRLTRFLVFSFRLHIAIVGTAVLMIAPPSHAAEVPLNMGISTEMFLDISEADTRIALDLVMREVNAASSGIKIEIYSDHKKYLSDIREGKLDYFPILTTSYLQMKEEGIPISGANAAVKLGDSPCVTYLLIAKKGAYRSLSDARGGTLIMESRSNSPLKELWLNGLLHENKIEEPLNSFLGKVKLESNARKALLPVFFKQADLCLIEKESWVLLNELNPQLNTQMHILAASEPLLEVINCIYDKSVNREQLDRINERLLHLNETIAGRTLLKFTKVKHFVPFQASLLNEVAKLRDTPPLTGPAQ